ncbi:MAG TPA: TetR/AcrR family transcriptional regulator [Clostridiales bacterium]|nr:TetR/AcrR family transcriptional regulator [Clostridiales bacterium]
MPKIVDHEKKKEVILEKALIVFVEKGYYNTRLSDIADECGMGRTTLYQYFKNKDEIFHLAVKHVFEVLENEYRRIIYDPQLTVLEKIKRIITNIVLKCINEKSIMVLLIDLWLILKRESNELLDSVNKRIENLRNVLSGLLEQGIKAKEIRPVNKDSMASALFGLAESYILQSSLAKDGSCDTQKYIGNIDIFIDGLKPEEKE